MKKSNKFTTNLSINKRDYIKKQQELLTNKENDTSIP